MAAATKTRPNWIKLLEKRSRNSNLLPTLNCLTTFYYIVLISHLFTYSIVVEGQRSTLSTFPCVPPNCTDIDECATDPCLNGGTCLDHLGEFRCVCPIGFVGLNCEREVDECASSPCLSGGTCIDGVGSYTCLCPAGLLGPNCSKDVDECISLPCLHGGRCEDKVGHFECHCIGGWGGKNCEFDIDECDASPCQHEGRCEDEVGDYTCHCRRSWSGRNCEISLDPCAAGPCLNNGTCTNKADGNFTCACPAGFAGIHCEMNQDECLSHPCMNGGTCEDRANGFHCHCPEEFVGSTCSNTFDDCVVNPCQHGGTCHSSPPHRRNSTCSCPAGFLGDRCEIDEDNCREDPECPPGHICRDLPDGYQCQCPMGFEGPSCEVDINECINVRCLNGGTCIDSIGNATCICATGFHGVRCELDLDECANNETYPCLNGMCQNTMGSFQCWCKPGYTGVYCDREYNECLPQPCQNGGTCRDLVAKYKCLCPLGFTGQNCSTDIDECASQPCLNNGTCSDGVGAFVCQCQPGYAGIVCEQDIDDCSSSPCQNAGACIDQVNGFLCDCSNTGFFGAFCQENIDDCASSPCIHESNCTDLVKNYSCSCYKGFNGHNCELDIAECMSHPCHNGGECIERSNHSVYEMDDEFRPLGFPLGPYSHSKAGGYVCICPSGFTGSDCEINIDDCAHTPCRNGTCIDGINEYGCECFRGFEGSHCETEIDECRRYRPCLRSTCIDKIGDYECQCGSGIGGKNCTVQLTGCLQNDCLNGATCVPYLIGEDRHARNCTCPTGFYGTTCQYSTTMSFSAGHQELFVMGNTSLDYHLSLRFRTTLPDSLLAFGHGRMFLLFLREGALRFIVERNNQSLITLGHGINNGEWWKVQLNFYQWGVYLHVGNSKMHWDTNVTMEFHGSIPTISSTNIGVKETWMKPEMEFHVAYIPNFVGCMEDVTLSGVTVIPNVDAQVTGITYRSSVISGCHRTEQCFPSTCNGGGTCIDFWNEYNCSCSRPHFGLHCEHEYVTATFGHENASQSLVEADIGQEEQRKLKNNATVSLFVRTRQSDGLIFYLGNGNSLDGAGDEDTFLAAEWESGVLRVSVKINGTPESLVDKMGRRLNDGYYQFLEVSLVNRTLSASINKTTIFKMDVEANKDRYLEANHLYLGGLPPPQALHFPPLADPTAATHEAPLPLLTRVARAPYFKGIMQDVRLNDWMVDIFDTDAKLPQEVAPRILQGNITKSNVLRGVQSDNACSSNPCQNGSNCTVTWNDYHCECKKGFRGKNCTDREFCAFNACPLKSECHSLSNGYECISNATFNGVNSSIIYIPQLEPEIQLSSISFYYRSERGGSILHIARGRHFFDVTLTASGDLKVDWNLNEGSSDNRSVVKVPMDSEWHFVDIALSNGEITISVDDGEQLVATVITSVGTLNQLTREEGTEPQVQLIMGGMEETGHYRGCLRELRLGGILLPFFPRDELSNDTSLSYFEAVTVENIQSDVCLLCYEKECQHGSTCLDQHNHFQCNCSKGYEGQLCQVNIDECQGITCENGGTCLDGVDAFTCECIPGYEGKLCEHDIDECIDGPCMHGGTCIDQLNSYSCTCFSNYTGVNCEKEKPFDCSSHPCAEGSTCVDISPSIRAEIRYECHCPVGRTGITCDVDIDYCQSNPCQNGAPCSNQPRLGSYNCTCLRGFEGHDCEAPTNFCKLNPCLHGGMCHSLAEDFNCTCAEGFQGKSCELDINECLIVEVCYNGGTCVNEVGTFYCNCTPPYTGQVCDFKDPCLIDNPCLNGGTCQASNNDNETEINCICLPEYQGDFCDEKVESGALDAQMLGIVIGSVVAATVLIVAGVLTVFLTMAKKKRATRGTYSPSRQEMFGSRVEMGHVMKPPPEERLI